MAQTFRESQFYELAGDAPGLLWFGQGRGVDPIPYCKTHRVALILYQHRPPRLQCPEDLEMFKLRINLVTDTSLARQKIYSEDLRNLPIVRIDPQGYEVLAREINKKDPRYWVDAKLSDTGKGLQLMVQAGKRNVDGKKVQLFVDLPAKRMSFDYNAKDQHPSGLFTTLNAEFKDTETTISDTSLEQA